MRIQLICPAPPGSRYGNRITALRWAGILRALGHRVRIAQRYQDEPCDLLIAMHAWQSAGAVFRFRRRYPNQPLVLALTGTDLYRDLPRHRPARQALELADRLTLFQPLARREVPARLRRRIRVIYQSVEKTPVARARPRSPFFDVCVVGHLRRVKDPLRAAFAVRRLPASSRLRVLQAGSAREPAMAGRARAEERRNPRYRWLGGLSYPRTRRLIARSRLLVLSSQMEGGANVLSEALVDAVPVLASRIPGSVGLLGPGYSGYFPVGDTEALRKLLLRAESDRRFYRRLKSWCARLAPRFHPGRERAQWRKLLAELNPRPPC